MRASRLTLRPNERHYGVIVTARNQQTGQMRSLHQPGAAVEALGAACTAIEAMGDDWRITAISTPGSIYRDLQGIRVSERKQAFLTAGEEKEGTHVEDPRPEIQQLGRVGYLHLLEDRRAL